MINKPPFAGSFPFLSELIFQVSWQFVHHSPKLYFHMCHMRRNLKASIGCILC